MSAPADVSLKQKMNALRPGSPYDMEKFMIYKLPKSLHHDGNKHLFEPSLVSIGPYHRCCKNLQIMQEYKLCYLRDFLDLDGYVQQIQPLEAEARKCYNQVIDLDSPKFIDMLLLDGCFILELSLKYKEKDHPIKCRPGFLFHSMRMDLLLFENQIPFFVLEELFLYHSPGSSESLVSNFQNLFSLPDVLGLPQKLPDKIKIHHLLHLYHELFVPRSCKPRDNPPKKRLVNPLDNPPDNSSSMEEGNCHVMPCATQLREAGVRFRSKKSTNKLDVKFKNGLMEIPTVKIDANLKQLYPNLLIFEVCLCHKKRVLSSYIMLLDMLINTKEDVELLYRHGIIENSLPDDEEMAHYLNLIGKFTYINYREHYFHDLFKDIFAYYNLRWNKHRARFVHDYCSSPWTFISVFAAFIILILTCLQAFFASYPYMH